MSQYVALRTGGYELIILIDILLVGAHIIDNMSSEKTRPTKTHRDIDGIYTPYPRLKTYEGMIQYLDDST